MTKKNKVSPWLGLQIMGELIFLPAGLIFGIFLIWWILMFIAQSLFGCEFVDTGLFRPAQVNCLQNGFLTTALLPILDIWQVIMLPTFFLMIGYILSLPFYIPTALAIGLITAWLFPVRFSGYKFPITIRFIFSTLNSIRKKIINR